MNSAKKIADIKDILKNISEKMDAINSNNQLSFKEKGKELEELSLSLYKNILSLNITEEIRDAFISAAQQSSEEEEANMPNQLEIDLFKETPEPEMIVRVENTTAPLNERASSNLLPLNIGLNDKFRFIRELFEGNTQEYTIAINQINSIGSKSEALHYIESLKNIYSWQDDAECFISFIEIVNKRFL